MATTDLTAEDETRVEEFAGRLFAACLGTMELANVELGVRLRLYEALATAGPMTARELANVAGIVERYAQEWLRGVLATDLCPLADPQGHRPQRDRQAYIRYYNFERAHTGRHNQGRPPADIVFGANKMLPR